MREFLFFVQHKANFSFMLDKNKKHFFTHTDVSRGKADIVAGFVFQYLPVKPWVAVHKAQHVEAETKSATTPAQVLKRAWFHFLSSTKVAFLFAGQK
jgi:hypothetical protein